MDLRARIIAVLGLLLSAATPTFAQITYVSQNRSVYARGTCGEELHTAPNFGPFNQSAIAACGSNVGTANHNSTLGPAAVHLNHDAGAGGGAEAYSEFNVVFDLATTVTYTLTASFDQNGSGTLTGPGTSITFGSGGVTDSSGTLAPGRYTIFSRVASPTGRPTLTLDFAVVAPQAQITYTTQYRRLLVQAPASGETEQIFAPDFGPFDAVAQAGTSATSAQTSWLDPTYISAVGAAFGNNSFAETADNDFQVHFTLDQPVLAKLDFSINNEVGFFGAGYVRFTGPGIDITLVANNRTFSERRLLNPGTYFLQGDAFSFDEPAKYQITLDISPFHIDWSTADTGGGALVGGAYQIAGTVGQFDASGPLANDPFKINAGFWPFTLPTCDADFNNDGFVTGDDFDQFVVFFIAGTEEADFNQDGFVTGDDFDDFVVQFTAGC